MKTLASLTAVMAFAAAPAARAATDIELWHSMDGAAGQQLERIARDFNQSQSAYRVVPTFKGSARETVEAGLAAYRAGHAPHIVEVDDAYRALATAQPRAFSPVYHVMLQGGEKLSAAAFVPAIAEKSLDRSGRLVSLPFTASTPVLYYNRDVFQAVGLDPEQPPRTWLKVQEAALKIVDAGAANCGFTTDLPAWVHLENLLSWHDQPFATGPRGKETQLAFNSRLMVLHVGLLSSWVTSGLFHYFGRRYEGEQRFAAGECAMLTGSSGSLADIAQKATFKLGVAALPMHEGFPAAPFSAMPEGGSLWVMSGKKKPEYAGVAKFFAFLSSPRVQSDRFQATGYLPTTEVAYQTARKDGAERYPGAAVALTELGTDKRALAKVMPYERASAIRAIVDDELEAAWSRRKTPTEAVDDAVERGNRLLKTFSLAPLLR